MKQIFSLLFVSLFFVACQKEDATINTALQEQTINGVSYGSDTAQRMDIYLPANRSNTDTKVIILVHGGAWFTGDKTDFNQYMTDLKQRLPGYAIMNINYRLAVLPSTDVFPTQENDVKAAFNFILSKADEYHFNKEKLAVLGASAGGHLALLQCYKNSTPKVKALVDMFGPSDMVAMYNDYGSINPTLQLGIQFLLLGTPTTNAALYQSSSPINYVSAQSPPTLILHGNQDNIVPIAQSTALKNKLQTAGVTVQMTTYNQGHGWTGNDLLDSYDKIVAFLNTYNP